MKRAKRLRKTAGNELLGQLLRDMSIPALAAILALNLTPKRKKDDPEEDFLMRYRFPIAAFAATLLGQHFMQQKYGMNLLDWMTSHMLSNSSDSKHGNAGSDSTLI